jgi:hypothetical protein
LYERIDRYIKRMTGDWSGRGLYNIGVTKEGRKVEERGEAENT